MNLNTLKRSAATLGVVAGLLAVAGPASAQGTQGSDSVPLEQVSFSNGAARGTQVGRATEELFGNYNFLVAATGTQVGSEGVKTPSPHRVGGYYDMSSPY